MRGMFRTVAIVLAGLASTAAQAAEDVETFYKGKQLKVLIGSGPGGGYDLIGRLMADHMGRHIPGNPTLVPQNVPGAGSLTLANQLFNTAPKDGTVFGVVTNGMPTAQIFTPETARFDISKFHWLGSPGAEVQVVMVWHTAPVQSIQELFTKELIVGGVAPGTATVDVPLLMNGFMGTKFKLISGYEGNTQVDLAMERGEVLGQAANGWVSAKTRNQEWLSTGKAKVIAQYGTKKHPDLPNVPLFDLPQNPDSRQAIEVLFARQDYGRPFLTPPGIPADRLQALQKAFMETMKDPAFLAAAEKAKLEIDPMSGEELDKLTKLVVRTSPEVGARIRAVLATPDMTTK
jgi:tripartite-type tricarboxylate transporter receptor subunit TctC